MQIDVVETDPVFSNHPQARNSGKERVANFSSATMAAWVCGARNAINSSPARVRPVSLKTACGNCGQHLGAQDLVPRERARKHDNTIKRRRSIPTHPKWSELIQAQANIRDQRVKRRTNPRSRRGDDVPCATAGDDNLPGAGRVAAREGGAPGNCEQGLRGHHPDLRASDLACRPSIDSRTGA